MKRFFLVMLTLLCAFGAFAETEVTVTSVTAQQRYPWNGKVDIVVTFTCAAEDRPQVECTFAATNSATKAAIPVAHLTRNGTDTGSGTTWTRKYIWDAVADVGEVKIADVALTTDATIGVQLWENGPYWATCNVGANKPEDSGYYFWWGDTVGSQRNIYNDGWVSVETGESCTFSYSDCPTDNKGNFTLRSAGYIDSMANLMPAYDAATAHLGAPWRMPTGDEVAGLVRNCTVWTTIRNGVAGRLVKGKGEYASKSIFLPAVGLGYENRLLDMGSAGSYWSATPYEFSSDRAWGLEFAPEKFGQYYVMRYYGRTVRPVRGFGPVRPVVMKDQGAATTHLALDCTAGTRAVDSAGEQLYYDVSWIEDGVTAQIYEDEVLLASGVRGSVLWKPKTCSSENRVLTMKVLNASGSVVATETVSFLTSALGHSEKVTMLAKAATCTTDGCTKGSICARCGETLSISTPLDALGHKKYTSKAAVSPTCTSTGCSVEEKCYRCSAVLTASMSLAALGHSEKVTTEARAATCTESGCTKGSYCTRCDATLATSTPLAALGHVKYTSKAPMAPTCTVAGNTIEERCSRCSALLTASVAIPAHGSSTGSWSLDAVELTDGAFEGCERLQRIDLSRNTKLKRIGKRAFAGCWNLEEVVLPPNLEVIDEEAFAGCSFVSRIVLPPSVVEIGAGAFEDCSYLQEFVFTGELETLAARTFRGCTQLQKITLPDGLTTIRESAFEGCRRMQSIILPLSLARVESRAFDGCSGLTGVTLPSGVAPMSTWFNSVYTQVRDVQIVPGSTAVVDGFFSGCSSLESVAIPEGVRTIGANAFKNCAALPGVRLPSTLTSIGASAFYSCTSLASVVIPDSVTSLGDSCFYNCLSLHDITLSQRLTELPDYTFYKCWDLDSFTVPASVTRLGRNLVTSVYHQGVTKGPREIYFLGNAPAYDADTYSGAMSSLTTYIKYNSRGWDGRASSRDIPEAWPTTGSSRAITYWVSRQFDVSYQANGGTFVENGATAYDCLCTTTELYAVPPGNPQRAGYRFAGWWTEPNGGTQITASTPVVLTKAHTLYAHWEAAVTVTVRFDSNGGDGAMDNQTINVGETKPLDLNVFTRTGWYFIGWSRAYNGSVVYKDGASVKDLTTAKDVVVLYAVWQQMPANTYQVIFADGAKRTTEFYAANRVYKLPTSLFTPPTGKRFAGWAGSNGRRYDPGVLVFNLVPTGGTIVLTAIWE